MNTKNLTDKTERKKVKRAVRKKAAPKAKRASGVARGSMKKKFGTRRRASGSARIAGRGEPSENRIRLRGRQARRPIALSQLFRTKSIDELIAASEDPHKSLRKTLGPWSLTALGIGAVIGSGIFTLTGTAAAGKPIPIKSILEATVIDLLLNGSHATSQLGRPGAGPAITLSFVLVAIACLFAGLCYAELASMIPVAAAYTRTLTPSWAKSWRGLSAGT